MYSYRSDIDFEWIPLSEDPMYAVVSPEHPFAFRSHIAPKECEGQPFIMPGRSMLASVPGTPQIIGYIMPVATMSAALAVIRVKKIRADNK